MLNSSGVFHHMQCSVETSLSFDGFDLIAIWLHGEVFEESDLCSIYFPKYHAKVYLMSRGTACVQGKSVLKL